MAAHAFSLIDSYVYGFVIQELSLPFASRAELDEWQATSFVTCRLTRTRT